MLFLFNDFLLIVKPKLFLRKAATPADLETFGKNEFIVYRNVSVTDILVDVTWTLSKFKPRLKTVTNSILNIAPRQLKLL